MIAPLLLAGLLGIPCQEGPPEIPEVLRRDPAELPHAAAGRFGGWPEAVEVDARAEALLLSVQGDVFADYPHTLGVLFESLEVEPDFPAALVVLGLSYFRLQRYGDAVTVYERFLAVVPGEIERTHALGHSYYSLGDYDRARVHYERILAAVPRSPEALRGLALAEMRLGDEEAAAERLAEALALAPDDYETHLWTARLHDGRGEIEAARVHVARALELEPFDPRGWYLELQTLYALGQEEDARAAEERWRELDRAAQELRRLEAILRIHPARFELIARTVELHRGIGDAQGVRRALARLEGRRPEGYPLCELRLYALDVLWSLDDREGAEDVARSIARECPGDLAAWRRLELHYGLTKDRVRQIEAARRVRELEAR